MMDTQNEIEALREHFEARKLDNAEAVSVCCTFAGLTIGLAAQDDGDIDKRIGYVSGWIRDTARKIVRSLRGDSGRRLQ